MSSDPRPASRPPSLTRGVIGALIFGCAALVLLAELLRTRPPVAVGAVVAGALLAAVLPRPLDLRSVAWAFFAPAALAYGWVAENWAVFAVALLASAAFAGEKWAQRNSG